MGGIVTFTGMVRLHSRGATIDHLEYEAYAPMAVKEMTRLCDEIEAEVAGAALAVEHRVGRLEIGDVAVVIAAAAPHRAEAFTACRAMIDRLKDRVPIWKKEVGDRRRRVGRPRPVARPASACATVPSTAFADTGGGGGSRSPGGVAPEAEPRRCLACRGQAGAPCSSAARCQRRPAAEAEAAVR